MLLYYFYSTALVSPLMKRGQRGKIVHFCYSPCSATLPVIRCVHSTTLHHPDTNCFAARSLLRSPLSILCFYLCADLYASPRCGVFYHAGWLASSNIAKLRAAPNSHDSPCMSSTVLLYTIVQVSIFPNYERLAGPR